MPVSSASRVPAPPARIATFTALSYRRQHDCSTASPLSKAMCSSEHAGSRRRRCRRCWECRCGGLTTSGWRVENILSGGAARCSRLQGIGGHHTHASAGKSSAVKSDDATLAGATVASFGGVQGRRAGRPCELPWQAHAVRHPLERSIIPDFQVLRPRRATLVPLPCRVPRAGLPILAGTRKRCPDTISICHLRTKANSTIRCQRDQCM